MNRVTNNGLSIQGETNRFQNKQKFILRKHQFQLRNKIQRTGIQKMTVNQKLVDCKENTQTRKFNKDRVTAGEGDDLATGK